MRVPSTIRTFNLWRFDVDTLFCRYANRHAYGILLPRTFWTFTFK